MAIKLKGATSGDVTLDVPAVAGTSAITVPAVTGTLITTADSATVTPTMLSQKLTLMTSQNTTSGTSVPFTNIPSWAKRITVMWSGLSTNGSQLLGIQLGTSGGFVTSGYLGTLESGNVMSSKFLISNRSTAAAIRYGRAVITNLSENIWIENSAESSTDIASTTFGTGSVTLAGTLTQLRIIANDVDTFDAGIVNVMYEG